MSYMADILMKEGFERMLSDEEDNTERSKYAIKTCNYCGKEGAKVGA